MPLAFGTMLLITLLPFGRVRQTAVLWTVVPMSVSGAAIGLPLTGLPQSEAISTASVSRLLPVVLAAGARIIGMAPLVVDPFFATMALTFMAGLVGAPILTLIGVPVLHHGCLRAGRRAGAAGAHTVDMGPGPLKRVPKPYPANHPQEAHLRRKMLAAGLRPTDPDPKDGRLPALNGAATTRLPFRHWYDRAIG